MACYVFYIPISCSTVSSQLLCNFDCHGDGVSCLITLWKLSQDLLEIYDETNVYQIKATPNYFCL